MYPRRGHGPQFPQDYMPNRNFQEGGWDRPQQKWYPDGPRRDQFYNSRAHGDNFGQYRSSYQGRGWRRPRGDFPEKHHYHGHSYRGAKTSFTKGRYQHTSRSPYVKTVPLKNKQAAEVSSSQAFPLPSAKTPTEKQTSSTQKNPHKMRKEPILKQRTVQREETCTQHAVSKEGAKSQVPDDPPVEPPQSLQMKEKNSEAANQTQSTPSPEVPVEEQATPEATERQPTAKQNSVLKQLTVQTNEIYIQHVNPKEGAKSQVLDGHPVEPPESLQMKERDSEAAESSANQTQSIISSEASVEEQTTPETTEWQPIVKENSILKQPTVQRDETCIQHTAPKEGGKNQVPDDYPVKTPSTGSHDEASPGQKDVGLTAGVCGFPLTLGSIHYVPVLVQKAEMKLLSSHSLPQTHVICDKKCDIERLLVCHSCSSKSHHCSASEYSSQNCVPRELCILSSRSSHRQEQELRSHKQEQKLRSSHKKKQKLRSFLRQEQSLRSSPKCKPSLHRQEQHSGSHQRRNDFVGSCCHCYCDHKYDCSLSQENSKESDLSPRYLLHKINDYHSLEERSETVKVPHLNSPASCTVKTKKKKVRQPVEMAKKKRTSSEKGTKFIKVQTAARNYEEMGSLQHPNTEEKASSSAISWTLEDRSAAVLAKKEEIEEAYLRVLLNFAVVAIMLVEKEPSMQTTIESALRANLRRTGDYYEHMLRNYIDSLAEASSEETQ
ncbi:uncharacterized protein LOC100560909 isoform X1 [Anolis carolinensis]|uniref:uncharacterized protein LOC100560909 isoform X1 n=1 Tax=Anolis carolinensis TaxID=28377 RepID=UPI002F2B4F9B